MDLNIAWLLVAIPLLSAALLLLLGRSANKWGHWLGFLASAGAAAVAILLLVQLLGDDPHHRVHQLEGFTWIPAGELTVKVGLLVDPLSISFALLITFVGMLIHLYSVSYMSHDPARRRFFAYLNLFIAAMLILVMADSYALLFVGWEGVGLASYLLIGFWNQNRAYAVAAKKAFIMNRVGDMGLLVGMMLMFSLVGGVSFDEVLTSSLSEQQATWISLALLVAACGKSAQFPLQAWLGDAMAGPTPVSALIHAATMVTAGVYLVVRSGPVFEAAPNAQLVVAIVGAITLLFGAIVGCAKDDIKKALAASTMSQIGYMILAAGLGPVGYVFAIFHLLTHGFFKAGMFLGAGSVMHGMDDEVNMRGFGALRKFLPVTWVTFGLGWLAILGVPPFSGFWSKDKIIETAFVGEGWQPWVFGSVTLLGAGITAFYMSRLFFMTFHGRKRWNDGENDQPGPVRHPHESPILMLIPMIVLAIGSVGLGAVLAWNHTLATWLEPVLGHPEHHEPVLPVITITIATLSVVLIGAALAWRQYGHAVVPNTAPPGSWLTRAARRDLYQDDVNAAVFERPGVHLTRTLTYTDSAVVDGAVQGLGKGTEGLGRWFSRGQNGYLRSYAAVMLVGAVIAVIIVVAVRW